MILLYILRSMANLGGTERVFTNKMNYLSEHGYDVFLVTYEQGNHKIVLPLNKKIRCYDLNTRLFTIQRNNILRQCYEYQRLLNKFEHNLNDIAELIHPDIIITYTYSQDLIKQIYRVSKRINAKIIIESHTVLYKIFRNKSSNNPLSKLALKFLDKYNLRYMSKADAVVVLTKGDSIEWQKYKKTTIIPNPIKIPNIRSKCTSHAIIALGRLSKEKAYERMIEAWSKVKEKSDWKINIYGDGSEKNRLNEQIVHYGLQDTFKLCGLTDNPEEKYIKSSIYLMSSEFEGLPMVLLEAMSYGLPCISFDCDFGPREIIHDGKDGFLIKDGDTNTFANKIEILMNNEILRRNMGKNGISNSKQFDMDIIMQKWTNLFNELCK